MVPHSFASASAVSTDSCISCKIPQMDVQAKVRAHHIGQQNLVLIFRLVSAHTAEMKITRCATENRELEVFVIAKSSVFPTQLIYQGYWSYHLTFSAGKFNMSPAAASKKHETIAKMASLLLRLAGKKINAVSNNKEGKHISFNMTIPRFYSSILSNYKMFDYWTYI